MITNETATLLAVLIISSFLFLFAAIWLSPFPVWLNALFSGLLCFYLSILVLKHGRYSGRRKA